MFDRFSIWSGGLFFSKVKQHDGWLIEVDDRARRNGTAVTMEIHVDIDQTMKEIFDQYTSADEYDFSRTHVPISLAKYKSEQLISRSQARRVLARFDRFREIMLDFQSVEMIGQGFADEIFRVYRNGHPEIEIATVNTVPAVRDMINRVARSADST